MLLDGLDHTDGYRQHDDFIYCLENNLPEHEPRQLGSRDYASQCQWEEDDTVATLSCHGTENSTG